MLHRNWPDPANNGKFIRRRYSYLFLRKQPLAKASRTSLAAEWFKSAESVLYAEHLGHAEEPSAAEAFLDAARHQNRRYRYELSLNLAKRGLSRMALS